MKREITLTITTDASFEDVSAMIALLFMRLDPSIAFSITSRPVINHDIAPGKASKARAQEMAAKAEAEVSPATPKREPTEVKYSADQRLVWDAVHGRIAITATLQNMGLTRDQLRAMPTKRGTLEYAVKRSMASRGDE